MNRQRLLFALTFSGSVVSTVAALVACSSEGSGGTGSPDAALGGDTSDAASDASTSEEASVEASADAPAATFQGCTDAELAAATLATNGSDVSFFTAGVDGGALVYNNNCVRIPKGKDVGWYGDFTTHPLSSNGEPGTPIPHVTTGKDSGRITFPTAGKFSFHCDSHPSTMFGTILVLP